MKNPISLPQSPFFCAQDGRYLPALTDLIIEAHTLLQRHEIERELFKLQLRRGCFLALAERAPQALIVQTPKPEPSRQDAGGTLEGER